MRSRHESGVVSLVESEPQVGTGIQNWMVIRSSGVTTSPPRHLSVAFTRPNWSSEHVLDRDTAPVGTELRPGSVLGGSRTRAHSALLPFICFFGFTTACSRIAWFRLTSLN